MFLAMSTTVNVAEFKDRFSELLVLVEAGGEVIVCRRKVPLARVAAIRKPAPRTAPRRVVGCMKGTVQIRGDLTEPCIPEADWDMLIATARHERLTLVSTDGKLRGYPHVATIA
ncbi:MAG: hypothetical protein FJ399_16165 [Verrucomicrobia bacterium]|nr:hypothetical protein [Verrucomicrobiota bacterium]